MLGALEPPRRRGYRAKRCQPSHIHPTTRTTRPADREVIHLTRTPGPGTRPPESADQATPPATTRPRKAHTASVH